MTSEAPYLHCRLCGVRYRSDQVIEHEKQCSNQSSDSKSIGEELAPVSSKDSGINELRDKEEYYMQAARSSESSLSKPKDPKSNEESIDSPLNLMNKGRTKMSREYQDELTDSNNRSEPAANKGGATVSREYHDEPTESHSRSESTAKKGGMKVSREYQDELTESHNRSEPMAWEIPSTDEASTPTQIKRRSPPNVSINNGEKSEHHQRSHSNEDTPVKIRSGSNSKQKVSPQKSDEEQKQAMMRTPYPSEEDIKIPSTGADLVDEAADILENLPELSKHSEMAYEKHQKSLVPCTHCERTFRPDRLPIHEKSCIKRPKQREYIVPEDEDKEDTN